jgi:hypothetical protein
MQEILIDGGKFVLENYVEEADDFGIAPDRGRRGRPYAAGARSCSIASLSMTSISSWHLPQFLSTPHFE